MNLEELKTKIENKEKSYGFVIFKLSDIDFIATQYIDSIQNINHAQLNYKGDTTELGLSSNDIFEMDNSDVITVARVDTLDYLDERVKKEDNLFIICSKISKEIKEEFSDYIIEIPKLENWQIKDYVYSILEGIPTNQLDMLLDVCKYDIFRIEQEVKKLNIFDTETRKEVFDKFISDDIFSDLSSNNMFDFSNAIMKKDFRALKQLYKEINNIDCEPLGLLTTLLNNFRNVILVQTTNNASPEACQLNSKQFWAIKYSACGYYSKEQLLNIFDFLSGIDKRIKTGQMPIEILVDYIVTRVLSL